MKSLLIRKLRKYAGTAFVLMCLAICLSFTSQAAMSESEVKDRLASYSESFTGYYDNTLYIDYPEWDLTQEEMYYAVSDMALALMGEPKEDYCQVEIRFYYKPGTHGYDLNTFGNTLFKYKKALGNFWTDWSRYNKMEFIVTSHSGGEKFSAGVTLKLNGSVGTKGDEYTKALLSIINDAKAVCSSDREMVDYYLNWLYDNVVYRYYTGFTNDPYYALIYKKTVCGGYANAFKDLCNASGIPAIVPVNEKANHAWSQVYVDGKWYTADLCNVVKSESGTYSDFLFTDPDLELDCKKFVESHKAEYVKSFGTGSDISITSCSFSFDNKHTYTGKAIKPAVTVTYKGKKLKKGTHYTLKYSANTLPGTGFITIEGINKNGYRGIKTLKFKISIPKPSSLTASTGSTSVTLKWKKVTGANRYIISIYDKKKKKYTELSRVKGTSCKVTDLKAGKEYTFSVRACIAHSTGDYKSSHSKISFLTKPATVKNLKLYSVKTTSLKLKWSKADSAERYEIYISTDGKEWKKKASTEKTSYTVKSLKSNKKYYFKVRAVNVSGKGRFSSKKSVYTLLPAPEITVSAGDNSLNVSWNKVNGAKGYAVYYSTDEELVGSKKIIVKGSEKTKVTIPSLKNKKTYYVRVKAYKTVDGEKIYGQYSSITSKKTK